VSKLLGISRDDPAFAVILAKLPYDLDKWDEAIPVEAAYKELGLKRYQLDALKTWNETTLDRARVEEIQELSSDHVHASSSSSNMLMDDPGPSSVQVKLENPEWSELQKILQTLKTGLRILFVFVRHVLCEH